MNNNQRTGTTNNEGPEGPILALGFPSECGGIVIGGLKG
jgi:hypothetical protein